MEVIHAQDQKIKYLIGGLERTFIIPSFQRNYCWNKDNAETFYNDILQSKKSRKAHYFGNVISYSGAVGASYQEIILVDGQQRITTVLLYILATTRCLKNDKIVESYRKNYLLNDIVNGNRVRLKQASGDRSVFEKLIEGIVLNDDEKKSNMNEVFEYFLDKLKGKEEEELIALVDVVCNFEIADIAIETKNNNMMVIQEIFEKINSAGEQLTSGDLIRNYLLIQDTAQKQDEFYNKYWVNIENNCKDISELARNYYIISSMEINDQKASDISFYKKFSKYFDENQKPKEIILNELMLYSDLHKKITNFSICENDNRNLKYLYKLKWGDLMPLLLYIYKNCISKNEISSIINLLVDFMIKYRIVKPYSGGTSLKNIVNNLLKKFDINSEEHIDITFENVFFELSNSYSPSERYPKDEEVKEHLMKSNDGTTYYTLLLLRYEDLTSKGLRVDVLDDLTLEHLFPQTENDWWIDNFGGKEKLILAQNMYMNCIGNLAILSRSENSINGNEPWPKKIDLLKHAQFKITNSVAKYESWKETEIKERNEELSNNIIEQMITPLERTRNYRTNNEVGVENFVSGLYSIVDMNFPESDIKINNILIDNKEKIVSRWSDLFYEICELANEVDSNRLSSICSENRIHKRDWIYDEQGNKKDRKPCISIDEKLLVDPRKVSNSNLYCECCFSESNALKYSRELIKEMQLNNNIQLDLSV